MDVPTVDRWASERGCKVDFLACDRCGRSAAAAFGHFCGQLCSGAYAEFGEDVFEVGLHGRSADVEALGDLRISEAVRDDGCDLAFGRGEAGPAVAGPFPLAASVACVRGGVVPTERASFAGRARAASPSASVAAVRARQPRRCSIRTASGIRSHHEGDRPRRAAVGIGPSFARRRRPRRGPPTRRRRSVEGLRRALGAVRHAIGLRPRWRLLPARREPLGVCGIVRRVARTDGNVGCLASIASRPSSHSVPGLAGGRLVLRSQILGSTMLG